MRKVALTVGRGPDPTGEERRKNRRKEGKRPSQGRFGVKKKKHAGILERRGVAKLDEKGEISV